MDSSSYISVDSGYADSSYAIKIDNTVWAWGLNNAGQLGLTNINATGDTINRSSPVQVGTSSWSQISVGFSYVLAKKTDSTLWGWGLNNAGQLAQSDIINRSSPVQISAGYSYSNFTAGFSHASALRTDLTAYQLWGFNTYGQLGDTTTISRSAPLQLGTDSRYKYASGFNTAILMPNIAFALGRNDAGQLGDATTINRSSPSQLASSYQWNYVSPQRLGTNSWISISTGNALSFGIQTNYTLWTWGLGTTGAGGTGNNTTNVSPVQIAGSWIQVCTAYYGDPQTAHTAGIQIDNTLWAWGNNSSGELAQGDTINRSSPIQIGTGYWSKVDVGLYHAAAISDNNLLYTWGLNTLGQLGTNDLVARSSPTQISSNNLFSQVEAGARTTLGIDPYGTIYSWGDNTYGQLGNG